MIKIDLIVAFLFMGLIFIRQIMIQKDEKKIDYAPLMLVFGTIFSFIHFIINPEIDNSLLVRESLFPFLIALFLYLIMNILNQTNNAIHIANQEHLSKELLLDMSELREFMNELESSMRVNAKDERIAREDVQMKFKQDLKTLESIKVNQIKFLEEFQEMHLWNKNVTKSFENFTNIQMPELDEMMHKHIDIFRVSEQDHYNKIKSLLQKAVDSRDDISDDVVELKNSINEIKNIADDISKEIVKSTLSELVSITKAFESQMLMLKSHSEAIKITLLEDENRLINIRKESELIMKQMVLSSSKMEDIAKRNGEIYNVYKDLEELLKDIEDVKIEYKKSQVKLTLIAQELQDTENEQIASMKTEIETLSETLAQKIDESLEKLHKHYHIADGDISASVQMLTKQVQMQKGYTSNE